MMNWSITCRSGFKYFSRNKIFINQHNYKILEVNKYCKFSSLNSKYPCNDRLHYRQIMTQCWGNYRKDEGDGVQKDARLTVEGYFKDSRKTRDTFIDAVRMFNEREKMRRGHIEFILAALNQLETYGVERDLEVYKALMDVFPKGKMVVTNALQREFVHYPKHQDCALTLLEEMEYFGVMPDKELQDLILNIFGRGTMPSKKLGRMLYWMPKFKNASPWPLPSRLPDDVKELARLALYRMASVDPAYKITEWQTSDVKDSIDDTWILSAISPTQIELISELPKSEPIKVEGPFGIFLQNQRVAYFILRAEAKAPPPKLKRQEVDDVSKIFVWMSGEKNDLERDLIKGRSIHEQDDGVILGMCATGSSSRDSLLSWIRLLEKSVPSLVGIPVLFNQSSPIGEVITMEGVERNVETSTR